jgi:hypothetical protein
MASMDGMIVDLKGIKDEAVLTKSRYYTEICLEGLRQNRLHRTESFLNSEWFFS